MNRWSLPNVDPREGRTVVRSTLATPDTSFEDPLPYPPVAGWLVRQVATDPAAPVTAAIVGPGGSGKSELLEAVASRYRCADVRVERCDSAKGIHPEGLDPSGVVLVDNAHQLGAETLDVLRELAGADGARLIVAYRAWPRTSALSALGAVLARRRSPVVLGHLERAGVAARITSRIGATPPDPLVDLVLEYSGGLPSLVDLVTQAMRDTGRFDPRNPQRFRRPDRLTVSAGLAERLRYQIDGLPPGVHELLQALAIGAALDTEVLTELLGSDPAMLADIVEATTATGMVTEDGELVPFIRNLLLRLMPVLRRREMQRRLASIQLDRGGSVLAAGRQLMGTGASGARVAQVLEVAGDEALRSMPALAAELYAGAVEAGASDITVAARRAQAAALAGDLDQALRLADQVVADPEAPDRERGTAVAAAVLAHRGLLDRSAELYGSLPSTASASLAVPALVGIGALEEANAVVAQGNGSASGRAPTLLAGAETLMARGMLATIGGTPTAAISQLARAAVLLEPAGHTVLLPDTPAALTALVAMQCGEFTVAESALTRAAAAKLGGRPAHTRHLLLFAWSAMTRGKLKAARRLLGRAAPPGHTLEPRDELVASALLVGLARREGDLPALMSAWARARNAIVRHPVDLYVLQPLGELAVAAARLGERDWVAPHLEEAQQLLDRLGNPVLWEAPLHWYGVHAAVAADHAGEAKEHAVALVEASKTSSYAAVLAAGASGWLRVMSGAIDPDAVQAAARVVHDRGLAWDGARLAGQAALRTTDRRAMAALLACARSLQSADSTPAADEPGTEDAARVSAVGASPAGADGERNAIREPSPAGRTVIAGPVADPPRGMLSERELEVGQLILDGLTYKQIGARLFISAKTVEHHVARMRQRLGAGSRDELFGHLRAMLPE